MSEDFIKFLFNRNSRCFSGFPDKGEVENFIDELYTVLFLPNDIDHKCEAQLRDQFTSLKDKFTHLLQDVIEDTMQIAGIRDGYFESLPALYSLLLKDAEALLQSDPAAQSLEEVMAAYPG